jgi:membrane protease YdiL (CAAX protease family)
LDLQDRLPAEDVSRRARLTAELLALYGGLPLLAYWTATRTRIPLIFVIAPTLLLFPLLLSLDRGFSWRALFRRGIARAELRSILLLFAAAGGALTLATYLAVPGLFLSLARERTGLWLMVLVIYPLISVQAQEIIWRVFFFRRYAELFEGRAGLALLVNALLFAFAHNIFRNWLSIVLTFVGGLLFAWRYRRTGSYWTVAFEHSLYGDLIFTVGLGRYFYLDVMRAAG